MAPRHLVLAGIVVAGISGSPGCRRDSGPGSPPDGMREGALDERQIAALIGPRVGDRAAWGEAIASALRGNGLFADRNAACAVIAIIAQESGFAADPVVPGLAGLIQRRLDRQREKLGPFGRPLFERLLGAHAPDDARSFGQRLRTARTERDVDVVFRDMLAFQKSSHPIVFRTVEAAGQLFDVDNLAELNPITTAGSMQVSVRFAEAWARDHRGDPGKVRDALYTRSGGVHYGVARLFGHQARYGAMIFRFADYNAGVYTSRNAAVQAQLGKLVGKEIAQDGDLLAYDRDGTPSGVDSETMKALHLFRDRHVPELSDRRLREDAEKEKSLAFETTETYHAIKRVYTAKYGAPRYAIVPDVEIDSPKFSGTRSTAWFAKSVERRYEGCLAQGRSP